MLNKKWGPEQFFDSLYLDKNFLHKSHGQQLKFWRIHRLFFVMSRLRAWIRILLRQSFGRYKNYLETGQRFYAPSISLVLKFLIYSTASSSSHRSVLNNLTSWQIEGIYSVKPLVIRSFFSITFESSKQKCRFNSSSKMRLSLPLASITNPDNWKILETSQNIFLFYWDS